MSGTNEAEPSAVLGRGSAVLGIELGSTRIKAVLVGAGDTPIAAGSSAWESSYVDSSWTYGLDEVWAGVQAAVSAVLDDAKARWGVRPASFAGVGVSGMMHGYLAFDANGELLVPFRTWRNSSAAPAARELSALLGVNIPERWSIAHLVQAVLDAEPHAGSLDFVTTLAGYVHWRLTGRRVLGVGDASGMFPLDPVTHEYDAQRCAVVEELLAEHGAPLRIRELFPQPLVAGAEAGALTAEGALLLDPTGTIVAGARMCPPEGDAGTGMVATGAVRPRTGNVSVGTSIFAMIVLERPLSQVHDEVDLVTTPSGDDVAMVHCNNGASELGVWAGVMGEAAAALGAPTDPDAVFAALLGAALEGEADAGGVLSFSLLAGEPILGLGDGRPMVVRSPGSRMTLANFMRSQVYGIFTTLHVGMRVLAAEGVGVDVMQAHGGVFRTPGVAQRFCAAAVGAPVAVAQTAGEGGAWGMAVLASYALRGAGRTLADYLDEEVFVGRADPVVSPQDEDVEGFRRSVAGFESGLAAVRAAVESLR